MISSSLVKKLDSPHLKIHVFQSFVIVRPLPRCARMPYLQGTEPGWEPTRKVKDQTGRTGGNPLVALEGAPPPV